MSLDRGAVLATVSLVSPAEQAELLALGRGAEQPEPPADPIQRLRQNAMKRPDHPAIVFGDEQVSYRNLVLRVGQLASRLRELGVAPGSRVAMCLSRGPDEPLSMLAIWAAGGAYVPVDPSHPRERIQMILEDAAPQVLIAHSELLPLLPVNESVRVVMLDLERSALAGRAPLPAGGRADPAQLAYVLFTSGSTGRPKGVAVPRQAIASFLRSMAHTPGLDADDRLLAVTTTTFDIAGLELLLPLWVGATVHIADRETALDGRKLRAALERNAITVMQATPTTWRILLEAGYGSSESEQAAPARKLRKLCGGEAMSRELAERLTATGGELWNLYGPTETTVWSTLAQITDSRTITIGRPIDNTQLYVLDSSLSLVPRGEVGELCIGGIGLAQGYLHRPELTSERFIQNPFSGAGELIYRTGDLARFLPNGDLECLGRIDHQVKIRGFRIELGEIESCMRRVPGVREVVVVADSQASAEPRLIGYWVGDADTKALQRRVHEALPSYMQPSAYVRLEEMPLNTNGKIDRNQLPAPALGTSGPRTGDAPGNDAEMRMAALFQAALGASDVPVDQDFFTLGGTSLSAMELRESIAREFGVELPLQNLFEAPTVRSLLLGLGQRANDLEPLFVRLRNGREGAPPLICVLGVTLYRELALALDSDRPVYGVHVPIELTRGAPLPRIEDVARKYVDLIMARLPDGPCTVAGLCFGGVVAFEVARQLLARGRRVESVALFDAALPHAERYDLALRASSLLRGALTQPVETAQETVSQLARAARRVLPARVLQLLPGLAAGGRVSRPARAAEQREATLQLSATSRYADAMVLSYDQRAAPLAIPVTVFRAIVRTESAWRRLEWDMGWSALASDIRVHSVTGSHLEIMREPHVRTIADVISELFRREQTPSTASARARVSP